VVLFWIITKILVNGEDQKMEVLLVSLLFTLPSMVGSLVGVLLACRYLIDKVGGLPSFPETPPSIVSFDHKSFTLMVKVIDRATVDDFDKQALKSCFQALAEEEEKYNGGWTIYVEVKPEAKYLFRSFYQATFEDVHIAKEAIKSYSLWGAAHGALVEVFEEIGKYYEGGDDDDEEVDPPKSSDDPIGKAVNDILANK
jgi:hypothetical protein